MTRTTGAAGRRALRRLAFATLVGTLSLSLHSAGAGPQEPIDQPSFETFLQGVRTEAAAMGIKAATLDLALADLTPEPVVVARDRAVLRRSPHEGAIAGLPGDRLDRRRSPRVGAIAPRIALDTTSCSGCHSLSPTSQWGIPLISRRPGATHGHRIAGGAGRHGGKS